MATLHLKVDGMRCGGCSRHLKKALEATPGVESADIDLEAKAVTVGFDAANTRPSAIKQAVHDAGFTVVD